MTALNCRCSISPGATHVSSWQVAPGDYRGCCGDVDYSCGFDAGHAGEVTPSKLKDVLVWSRPNMFSRPSYVGHRGWRGVGLDRDRWDELADLLSGAFGSSPPRGRIHDDPDSGGPDARD